MRWFIHFLMYNVYFLMSKGELYDEFCLLRASEGSTLRSLFEQLKFAAFIRQNKVLTDGATVAAATRRFRRSCVSEGKTSRSLTRKMYVIECLSCGTVANLNALEFRNFLINRSIRDRVRSVICILNISCRARQPRGIKPARCIFLTVTSGTSRLRSPRGMPLSEKEKKREKEKDREGRNTISSRFAGTCCRGTIYLDLNRCLSA